MFSFTILASCEGGHRQSFALAGCDRAWVERMAGLLDGSLPGHTGGACHQCGAKVTAEVREHGKGTT